MATGASHRAVSVETIAAGSCGDPARPGGAGQTGAGGDGAGGARDRGRLDQRRILAIADQPDPGPRDHRFRARIRERLHLELALPAVDGVEAASRRARMTGELRESRAQLPEEGHQRIDADQAEIRLAVGPLPVEVADVPDPGGAAKRDAVFAARGQEEPRGRGSAMYVVMGVQVGREAAGQIAEGSELARQLPLKRAAVREIDRPAFRGEVDVEPDAQARMPAGEPDRGARARPVDHQARAGDDAALVRPDDAAVDVLVCAEVVGVDDQVPGGTRRAVWVVSAWVVQDGLLGPGSGVAPGG
jgi:hypothetical protein